MNPSFERIFENKNNGYIKIKLKDNQTSLTAGEKLKEGERVLYKEVEEITRSDDSSEASLRLINLKLQIKQPELAFSDPEINDMIQKCNDLIKRYFGAKSNLGVQQSYSSTYLSLSASGTTSSASGAEEAKVETPAAQFARQLQNFMGGIVPESFSDGLQIYISVDFFTKTPDERLTVLSNLRSVDQFMQVLMANKQNNIAKDFLTKSIGSENIFKIKDNRLGLNFFPELQFSVPTARRAPQLNPAIFLDRNGLQQRERRRQRRELVVAQLFLMMNLFARQTPRHQRPQVMLEEKIGPDVTQVFNQHNVKSADGYENLRCPITQCLITGTAVKIKMGDHDQYFDAVELAKHDKNPLTNKPKGEVLPAPEYRGIVLDKIKEQLQVNKSPDEIKEIVAAIAKKLGWEMPTQDALSQKLAGLKM